jgi:hypothetical protein
LLAAQDSDLPRRFSPELVDRASNAIERGLDHGFVGNFVGISKVKSGASRRQLQMTAYTSSGLSKKVHAEREIKRHAQKSSEDHGVDVHDAILRGRKPKFFFDIAKFTDGTLLKAPYRDHVNENQKAQNTRGERGNRVLYWSGAV